MKHSISIIVLILLLIQSQQSWCQNTSTRPTLTVVLDPGHGGKDPGALVGKVREKDIVLNVSNKVGAYLKKSLPEVKVVYTRTTDVFIPLNKRSEIANKANANLFVSIHANACGTPSVRGTETYTLGLHKSKENLEVAKKENAAILLEDDYSTTYEGFEPNFSESYIIFELLQNAYLEQSLEFAQLVQNQFRERVGRKDRGVRQAGFLVLRETAMPSALVELGYLTNSSERSYLASEDGQVYLASAIYRAIKEYATHHGLVAHTPAPLKVEASNHPEVKPKELKPKESEGKDPIKEEREEIRKEIEELEKEQKTKEEEEEKKAQPLMASKPEQPIKKETPVAKPKQENKQPYPFNKKETTEGIEFCVQIGASRVEIKNPNSYFKVKDPITMKRINGYYKYYVGCSHNYNQCIQSMRIVKQTVSGAWPVAFENGKPISVKVALQKTGQ